MKQVSLRTGQRPVRAIIKSPSPDQKDVIAFVQDNGHDIHGIVVKFVTAAARQKFASDARTTFGANLISIENL